MRSLLERACEQGDIRPLDLHVGIFLEKQTRKAGKLSPIKKKEQTDVLLAAALASAAVGNGHVCWPLAQAPPLPVELESTLIPEPKKWRESLLATSAVGQPGETSPLILDKQNRLYLYRFHCCEEFIARDLGRRAEKIH
ncbi:MAG: hypothetical protein D3923_09680, partial [Candidatus Electrothrix sp. AR3]|nr:hypothetical protein [Candidatus Electrothrix sp. AR3]